MTEEGNSVGFDIILTDRVEKSCVLFCLIGCVKSLEVCEIVM